MRDFTKIELSNLTDDIKKVYRAAIETNGNEAIFQYEYPFVRVHINSEFAIFELSPSKHKGNEIKSRVKIDMKTYDILNKEIH